MKGGENMYLLTKLAKNKVILTAIFTVVLSLVCMPVFAADPPAMGDINFGLSYGAATGLGDQDVRTTISSIINVALTLLGIVAVVIVLIGGFKWMTAGGNEEKTGEARKLIFAGIIGIAIILSAYAIAKFVLAQLYQATTGLDYTNQTDI